VSLDASLSACHVVMHSDFRSPSPNKGCGMAFGICGNSGIRIETDWNGDTAYVRVLSCLRRSPRSSAGARSGPTTSSFGSPRVLVFHAAGWDWPTPRVARLPRLICL
jgi:hypothetical protein